MMERGPRWQITAYNSYEDEEEDGERERESEDEDEGGEDDGEGQHLGQDENPDGQVARQALDVGLDVGGVLVDRVAEGDDTSFFGSRPMETPAVAEVRGVEVELTALIARLTLRGAPRPWLSAGSASRAPWYSAARSAVLRR